MKASLHKQFKQQQALDAEKRAAWRDAQIQKCKLVSRSPRFEADLDKAKIEGQSST